MNISPSIRNKILIALSLTLLGLSIYVIHHLVKTVHYSDIVHELRAMTWTQLGLALLSTTISYLALGWTEVISLQMARIKFPASKAFFSAFIAQSIVHLTGFSIFLGAILRYRFYAPYGLKLSDVTRAQVFFSSGFALSTIFLLAITLILDPTLAAEEVGGSIEIWRALGVGMLILFGVAVHYMKSDKPIHIFKFTLRHAGGEASTASFPLIIASILDIMACAGALYVLLPPELNVSFFGLLAAFLIAVSLSVTSNVPGGLGIIEAAILTLLHPAQEMIAPTIGALLMFRAIYYVVPFLLSICLQGLMMLLKLRSFADFLAPIAPQACAVLTFSVGAVLMFSGVTPVDPTRLHLIGKIIPLPLIEGAHFASGIIAVLLLVAAHGLSKRLDGAWWAALFFSIITIPLALSKGMEIGVTVLLVLNVLLLLPARKSFYRHSSIIKEPITIHSWMALATVFGLAIWLLMFAYHHIRYHDELWWHIELNAQASRSLRAALASAVMLVVVGFWAMLHPPRVTHAAPTEDDLSHALKILNNHPTPTGWIALIGDKQLLFNEDKTAFLMYAISGKTWVALGEPIGPKEKWDDLLWRFLTLCDRYGDRIAFYQIKSDSLLPFINLGLHPFMLGENALIKLADFTLQGARRASLRHSCNKAEREGATFEVIPAEAVPALLPRLRAVSDNWLEQHEAREKQFSVGYFDAAYLVRTPMAIIRHQGEVVAFANLWPSAAGGTLSIDLMRYEKSAPPGTMDYLLVKIILWAKEQGYAYFDLGMAPLSGLPNHPLAGLWAHFARLTATHGDKFYNFEGLRAFKGKFDPEWNSAYLFCKPYQLAAVLIDVTKLISGGLSGLIKK